MLCQTTIYRKYRGNECGVTWHKHLHQTRLPDLFLSAAPQNFYPTPAPPTPIPGQPQVLQLERRGHGRHRWKSIKWLELTGMENVSAMIQTRPSLITTLMHSTLVADPPFKVLHNGSAAPLWFLINSGMLKE